MRNIQLFITVLFSPLLFVSCKKMVDVGPPKNDLTTDIVFGNDATATAALSNVYITISSFTGNCTRHMGLYTDELNYSSIDLGLLEYVSGKIAPNNTSNSNRWNALYSIIYQTNVILERLDLSQTISPSVKTTLRGEALFLRSFAYSYLLSLFGDVPLLTSSDVRLTNTAPRTPEAGVWNRVIEDLKSTKLLLEHNYPVSEKTRANKWAASALLARVYLYNKQWTNAEIEADSVINSGQYSIPGSLSSIFIKNSPEAILQIWNQNGFSPEGSTVIPSGSNMPTYPITSDWLNLHEPGDQRRTNWVKSTVVGGQTYYYPYKYKNRTTTTGTNAEYTTLLRFAEVYLIRSEARAMQNRLVAAKQDLDIIRNRAGLPGTTAADSSQLLEAIEKERRIELFYELGHRFFDLKRTHRLDIVNGPIKPQWISTGALLPIPQYELLNNPSLHQNPGY